MPNEQEMQLVENRARDQVRRGEEAYKKIASLLEIEHEGEYVVIDLETGRYLVDKDEMKLLNRADQELGKNIPRFYRKIGGEYPHLGFFGG